MYLQTCLLAEFVTPKSVLVGLFVVTHRHMQNSEKFVQMHEFPAEGDQGDSWPSSCSPTVNMVAFLWSTCAKFSMVCVCVRACALFTGDFIV